VSVHQSNTANGKYIFEGETRSAGICGNDKRRFSCFRPTTVINTRCLPSDVVCFLSSVPGKAIMVQLVQVTNLPEDRVAEVLHFVKTKYTQEEVRNVGKLFSSAFFILIFATTDDNVNTLLTDLYETCGIGHHHGSVYVVPVSTARPLMESKASVAHSRTVRLSDEALVSLIGSANSLTFDYFVMLVVASVIAGAGLATNNAVVVVASMLVSPVCTCSLHL